MPREFIPPARKREPHMKAQLFPRTAARVMAGPPCDRMIDTGETATRRKAKQALRELMDAAHELQHVRD